VDLVEDDEAEGVTHRGRLAVRRVVRRHRDCRSPLLAAAKSPDRHVELRVQLLLPLLEEVDRRDDDERRNAFVDYRADRDDRLAGTGRELHDSPLVRVVPGGECRPLVRTELVRGREVELVRGLSVPRRDAVVDRDAGDRQGSSDRSILVRWGSARLRPRIRFDPRQRRERRLVRRLDAYRAGLVREADGHQVTLSTD